MSEHPREAQRHLKKINLCDDVCFDTLDFFGPATLGLKIALISSRFDALVDQILRRKRWQIDVIQIRRMGDGTGPLEIAKDYGDIRKKSLTYPIADSPLLNGITGFKYLDISYVNDDVITFLRRFQRLFNQTGIRLCFMIFEGNQGWDMVMRDLWPLVAKNVIQLFLFGTTADLLNRYLTASVLLHDCVNVEAIRTPYVFPEALPLEEEAKNLGQALFKWLHVPMHNGRPKKLISNCSLLSPEAFEKSMEGFKKCFVNATTPVSYIIAIEREFYGGLFELENGRTQERLTINGRYRQYLKRFPIEWDASRLHNLEGEVLCSYFMSGDNLIDVSPFQGEKELREKYWTA